MLIILMAYIVTIVFRRIPIRTYILFVEIIYTQRPRAPEPQNITTAGGSTVTDSPSEASTEGNHDMDSRDPP